MVRRITAIESKSFEFITYEKDNPPTTKIIENLMVLLTQSLYLSLGWIGSFKFSRKLEMTI